MLPRFPQEAPKRLQEAQEASKMLQRGPKMLQEPSSHPPDVPRCSRKKLSRYQASKCLQVAQDAPRYFKMLQDACKINGAPQVQGHGGGTAKRLDMIRYDLMMMMTNKSRICEQIQKGKDIQTYQACNKQMQHMHKSTCETCRQKSRIVKNKSGNANKSRI